MGSSNISKFQWHYNSYTLSKLPIKAFTEKQSINTRPKNKMSVEKKFH